MKRWVFVSLSLMFFFTSHISFAQSLVLQLPFSSQEIYRISRGYGTKSHINKDFYALDFAVLAFFIILVSGVFSDVFAQSKTVPHCCGTAFDYKISI